LAGSDLPLESVRFGDQPAEVHARSDASAPQSTLPFEVTMVIPVVVVVIFPFGKKLKRILQSLLLKG
jgi:hypothetical protein